MKERADRDIQVLELIADNRRISAGELAERLKLQLGYVRNILFHLKQPRLIESPSWGTYEITQGGQAALEWCKRHEHEKQAERRRKHWRQEILTITDSLEKKRVERATNRPRETEQA